MHSSSTCLGGLILCGTRRVGRAEPSLSHGSHRRPCVYFRAAPTQLKDSGEHFCSLLAFSVQTSGHFPAVTPLTQDLTGVGPAGVSGQTSSRLGLPGNVLGSHYPGCEATNPTRFPEPLEANPCYHCHSEEGLSPARGQLRELCPEAVVGRKENFLVFIWLRSDRRYEYSTKHNDKNSPQGSGFPREKSFGEVAHYFN